jgi:N-methylhydantoinase B
MNNVTLGGHDPFRNKPFAYYETIGGGCGAGPRHEGASGIQVAMTNTWNTPVEAMEFALPLIVERYELRRASGGTGAHRGGQGVQRNIKLLAPAQVTLLSERRSLRPYGLAGGGPGRLGRNRLHTNGRWRPLPGKGTVSVEPGDVIAISTPGGGGWGKP